MYQASVVANLSYLGIIMNSNGIRTILNENKQFIILYFMI